MQVIINFTRKIASNVHIIWLYVRFIYILYSNSIFYEYVSSPSGIV